MKNDQLNEDDGHKRQITVQEKRMIIFTLLRYSLKEMAPLMKLKESTVKTYRKKFYDKYDLQTLFEYGHFVRDIGYTVNRRYTHVYLNDKIRYVKSAAVNNQGAGI